MSLDLLTEVFPELCNMLKELSTEVNSGLDECEQARAAFFGAVVLYKIKVDAINKIKEDKSIDFNFDANLAPEENKLSFLLNSGAFYNYPFEKCPNEVFTSLISFSLSYEGKDKEDSLSNLQAFTDILAKFKELPEAQELEADYNVFIYTEELRNYLIIALKINEKYANLLKKFETVFPIEKYFLSFLGKISLSNGVKWNEFNHSMYEELNEIFEKPHFSFALTMRNFEIVNELFSAILKMEKMFNPEEKSKEEKRSMADLILLISFIQAFKSLSLDFKMAMVSEVLKKILGQYYTKTDFSALFKEKKLLSQCIDLIKAKKEACEIHCFVPLLKVRATIALLFPGIKEFLDKEN